MFYMLFNMFKLMKISEQASNISCENYRFVSKPNTVANYALQ